MDIRADLIQEKRNQDFTNEAKVAYERLVQESKTQDQTELEMPVTSSRSTSENTFFEARYLVDQEKVRIRIVDPQEGDIVRFIPPEDFKSELIERNEFKSGAIIDIFV